MAVIGLPGAAAARPTRAKTYRPTRASETYATKSRHVSAVQSAGERTSGWRSASHSPTRKTVLWRLSRVFARRGEAARQRSHHSAHSGATPVFSTGRERLGMRAARGVIPASSSARETR